MFWTYTLITYDSEQEPEREAEPGLAAGGQVRTPTGEQYGLYYLFPLTEQEQTLDLVRTARDGGPGPRPPPGRHRRTR